MLASDSLVSAKISCLISFSLTNGESTLKAKKHSSFISLNIAMNPAVGAYIESVLTSSINEASKSNL